MRFLLLLSLMGCTAVPKPVVFGFAAVQCIKVRSVVCVADADYPAPVCLRDVPEAINEVNKAVGHEVFRFNGIISPLGMTNSVQHGELPVFGLKQIDLPHPSVLALTVPHAKIINNLPCISTVVIAVGPRIAGLEYSPFNPVWVLAHELVHALGAEHADPDGGFVSRMEPAYPPRLHKTFTQADINTLRAVYGN